MERFDQIFTKVCDHIALYLGGIIALSMMFYVSANVFSRYVLRIGGVMGTYTYVGALLVPLVYLGLSYAWYKRGYVVIDMVQGRLKGRVLWGFQFAFLLLTVGIFVLAIFYGALTDTIDSYIIGGVVGEAGHRTPAWPWKITIVVGMLLMAIRNILDMIRMVRTGEVISADR